MKKISKITINEKWCKSCEICVYFCPKKVYDMGRFYPEVARPEDCIACKLCEKLCPDFAITVTPPDKAESRKK
ncbi:MAG: 4Fe-4S binding protein [Candidatus Marinimicrobia bacterium]|nr:4Fe-4S binding protein [Candidatus Neomarinimicrobiota bacterium]